MDQAQRQRGADMTPFRLSRGAVICGYPASALRTEARRGNLVLTRVAGKDYVTERAIRDMERKCQHTASPPDCGSGRAETEATQHGSSSTGVINSKIATFRRQWQIDAGIVVARLSKELNLG